MRKTFKLIKHLNRERDRTPDAASVAAPERIKALILGAGGDILFGEDGQKPF
jgi:hypothetical protein